MNNNHFQEQEYTIHLYPSLKKQNSNYLRINKKLINMKNLILLLSLFLFNSLQAQQESLSLKAFDQLNVAGSINITLYEGSPKAEITMIQGDRDELEVIQKGNKLRIKFKNRINWSGKRKANINLYVQNLVSISVAAGAEVYSEFTLKANEFYVDVSSGAELSIALETKMLDADVNSGGSIDQSMGN